MKHPWEWDEGDVQSLIDDEVSESSEVEYKACAALDRSDKNKDEVSKDVSAFANAGGGVIILRRAGDEPSSSAIDADYGQNEISKEWPRPPRSQPWLRGAALKSVFGGRSFDGEMNLPPHRKK